MKKKLIIWDFDGVIADTDYIWIENLYKNMKSKFNIKDSLSDFYTKYNGMSSITQRIIFNDLGYKTSNYFWKNLRNEFIEKIKRDFPLIDGVCKTISEIKYSQCLATGTPLQHLKIKIKLSGLESIFNKNNTFSSSMVEKGKPEPDLFLLAAKTMGYKPEDCIVIEDSIAGLTAAIKANMTPIAFTGSDICQNNAYKNKVKELGIKYIFDDMNKIKELLIKETL